MLFCHPTNTVRALKELGELTLTREHHSLEFILSWTTSWLLREDYATPFMPDVWPCCLYLVPVNSEPAMTTTILIVHNISGDGGSGHWLVRMEWRPSGWSLCLPLLIFSCTIKSRSSLLAPADPGGPRKSAENGCVCVCVCVWYFRELYLKRVYLGCIDGISSCCLQAVDYGSVQHKAAFIWDKLCCGGRASLGLHSSVCHCAHTFCLCFCDFSRQYIWQK